MFQPFIFFNTSLFGFSLTCFEMLVCFLWASTGASAFAAIQENRFAAVMRRDPKHAQESCMEVFCEGSNFRALNLKQAWHENKPCQITRKRPSYLTLLVIEPFRTNISKSKFQFAGTLVCCWVPGIPYGSTRVVCSAVRLSPRRFRQELDDRLQEQVVQKNHLLQVLNKEDLEGTASCCVSGTKLRWGYIYIYTYTCRCIHLQIWVYTDLVCMFLHSYSKNDFQAWWTSPYVLLEIDSTT